MSHPYRARVVVVVHAIFLSTYRLSVEPNFSIAHVCITLVCLYQNLKLPTLMMVYSSCPKQIWSSISRHQLYCQTETHSIMYIIGFRFRCEMQNILIYSSLKLILKYCVIWLIWWIKLFSISLKSKGSNYFFVFIN